MATIKESMRRLGVEPPEAPKFTSEDLPYLIMTTILSGDTLQMGGMMVAMAMKIEELEDQLFQAKFAEKED